MLATGAVYLAVKAVAVATIFAHFNRLRSALSPRPQYEGFEWTAMEEREFKSGELGRSRAGSEGVFLPPRRRRSSSGSSIDGATRASRSNSLPSYASLERGYDVDGDERQPSNPDRKQSYPPSSRSRRPRLVLVPVFGYNSLGSPSSSRSGGSSASYSPTSSMPPFYAIDTSMYSPTRSHHARSSSSSSHPGPHPFWHDAPEQGTFSSRHSSGTSYRSGSPTGPAHCSSRGPAGPVMSSVLVDEPESFEADGLVGRASSESTTRA